MAQLNDPFESPQTDFIKFSDLKGLLVLVMPIGTRHMTTVNGETEAIDADVVLLEGKGPDEQEAPVEYKGVTIFGQAIVPTLKRSLGGKPVLGVPAERPAAKKGFRPALILAEASEEQKAVARKWWESQSPFADPNES